jgi:hypothetical protein
MSLPPIDEREFSGLLSLNFANLVNLLRAAISLKPSLPGEEISQKVHDGHIDIL